MLFHESTLLRPEHWCRLQGVVQRRVLRYFRTHGLLNEPDALDMLSWQASGGFSIDASVRIEEADRAGLERLVRYCARPPFALERLHALAGVPSLASPDARLLYRFPKPTPDGRTELVLSPLQLLERLVAFVPPPRIHRHRYHGVLAPHAGLRAAVVAIGRGPAVTGNPADAEPAHPVPGSQDDPPRSASPARIRWAVLLARIYEVLPLLCPACGGSMRILAFLTDPPVVSAILLHSICPAGLRSSRPPAGRPSMTSCSTSRRASTPKTPSPSPTSCSTSPCPPTSTTDH